MTSSADRSIDLQDFGLFDEQVQQCPHAYYRAMRSDRPVFPVKDGEVHLVTRYEDILAAVKDPETFSSRIPGNRVTTALGTGDGARAVEKVLAEGYPIPPTMLTNDPPAHTRFRRLVGKALNPRRVASTRPEIESIASGLVDAFVDRGQVELVSEFASPLPVRVIAKFLSVPSEHDADIKRWTDLSTAGVGRELSEDEWIESYRGIVEFQHFFAEMLDERRERPQDDFLSDLVHARIDDEDVEDTRPLDMSEMLAVLHQLMAAGNETLTKLITEAMRLLVENPAAVERLRADTGYAKDIVEEALRLATPAQGNFRVVTRDTTLGGVDLPKGSMIALVYASANRDDQVFPTPEEFRPGRDNARDHLAFGQGRHYCIGQALARLEAEIAVIELGTRLDNPRFAEDAELTYTPSFILRGLTDLHLEFDPPTP